MIGIGIVVCLRQHFNHHRPYLQHTDILLELYAVVNQRIVWEFLLSMELLQRQELRFGQALFANTKCLMLKYGYGLAA